jgi:hydroxyacylglutathione hydrolase
MLLRQIYDEDLAQAAWLLGCQKTGEAIVIDPERDVDRYLQLASEHGLRIVAVAETHIHADFLSGARALADAVGARVMVSGEGGDDWRSRWLEGCPHQELHDGDTFRIGGIEFRVHHTPGHTPEHISFLVTDVGGGADEPLGMLSGDFVFVGDLGRPDLLETAAGISGMMEGSARQLAASARSFLELPDYIQVLPAHGAGSACGKALGAIPQSTVGYERRFNQALSLAEDDTAFVSNMLSGQPAPPLYFKRMKQQNRDGVPRLVAREDPEHMTPEDLARTTLQVIDLRAWDPFRANHLPGALWTKTGAFFCASIGSYVTPDQELALICQEDDLDRLRRCLVRIGLDKLVGWCSLKEFEASIAGDS